jgi:hypothetical protein
MIVMFHFVRVFGFARGGYSVDVFWYLIPAIWQLTCIPELVIFYVEKLVIRFRTTFSHPR